MNGCKGVDLPVFYVGVQEDLQFRSANLGAHQDLLRISLLNCDVDSNKDYVSTSKFVKKGYVTKNYSTTTKLAGMVLKGFTARASLVMYWVE